MFFWTTLQQLWDWLVDVIFCAMKRWICWFLELVLGWVEPLFGAVLDTLGPAPNWDLTFIGNGLGAASFWFPITEAAGLCGAYFAFKAAFLAVYLIKRFIPTMG